MNGSTALFAHFSIVATFGPVAAFACVFFSFTSFALGEHRLPERAERQWIREARTLGKIGK